MFSNIEFLKNITLQTKKQNELKHLMVLLARLLALAALILAFAGPQWKDDSSDNLSDRKKLSILYVDNSLSMMAEGESGRLFDQAINTTKSILSSSQNDTRFALLTNELSFSTRLLTRDAMLSEVELISISPSERHISSVLRSCQKIITDKNFNAATIYLLSDFQTNAFDANAFPKDTLGYYNFLPVNHAFRKNVFIDSCWIDQPIILPSKSFDLNISLGNASDSPLEKIPLKLFINDQQKAAAGADLAANDEQILRVTITPDKPGWHYGLIQIEDYPVTFDDSYYFSFEVQSRIPVLVINGAGENNVLRQFYESDSIFDLDMTDYRNVNYNSLDAYSLIVLNSLPGLSSGLISQIKTYTENGGNVIFIPTLDEDLKEENAFLKSLGAGRIVEIDTAKTRVVNIKENHPLFREIITDIPQNADLPVVRKHLKYSYTISSGIESLISLLNGDDFLLTRQVKNGRLFMLSVPLDLVYSNFMTHPLFIPVMYGAALQGNPKKDLAYTVKKDIALETKQFKREESETPFILSKRNETYTFIPEQMRLGGKFLLNTHEGIASDGFYELMLHDSVYHVFSYNYNRLESEMYFLSIPELEESIKGSGIKHFSVIDTNQTNPADVVEAIQKDKEFWKLFIIFALLMLLVEVLILRFWK